MKLGVDSAELRYVPEAERVIAESKGPIANGASENSRDNDCISMHLILSLPEDSTVYMSIPILTRDLIMQDCMIQNTKQEFESQNLCTLYN